MDNNLTGFAARHIGISGTDVKKMLDTLKVTSLDMLIDQTIPPAIRLKKDLKLDEAMTEAEYLSYMRDVASKNKVFKSWIGMGYSNSFTPSVILRNIFENPGWYTQYTPYQAEIAQGRLESLLNFQTMVIDLTKMDVANASLLDEPTAAAEGMGMLFAARSAQKVQANAHVFMVSDKTYPQTIDVLKSRALPLGIDLQVVDIDTATPDINVFGVLLQNPDINGELHDYTQLISKYHEAGVQVVVAADILSLTLIKSPGEMGADVSVGSTQRLGIPMGYGGPHAAYFATKEEFKRHMPGRIIGVSIDSKGNKAYRMALQTREQHIRREKATSNICTAQALLANMSAMYAVYHGPEGLKQIAANIHTLTVSLSDELEKLGYTQHNKNFFDTINVSATEEETNHIKTACNKANINLNYLNDTNINIAFDETTTLHDVKELIAIFAAAKKAAAPVIVEQSNQWRINQNIQRNSRYLEHPVFNTHHTETQMMRYMKQLENKDIALNTSMIALGSCTMKLNAATEMMPLSWPEFANIHPFAPIDQAKGYQKIIKDLEKALTAITGFDACSLQPNSGAQGEFAGLMVIRAYHHDRGGIERNVVLIPSSAHGTNPASAVMAGMHVVVVSCDADGNIIVDDLKAKAELHKDNLSCLMVTYPSTHGVFEEQIKKICKIIHDNGGLVYMDGANMNAQVGLTSPANIGADVNHINLHKTFSIPHGGGGPGMGPICVAKHLAPYLPGHSIIKTGGDKAISAVNGAPYGSASILLISYAYIKMLGAEGCTDATKYAILNANYMLTRLEPHYKILFRGAEGRCAHEFIIDLRDFKNTVGIEAEDVAKRLMDYGFHAPTMSFPVAGTIMIEPTESEDKAELDRFCDALISIRHEIQEIADGIADKTDNVLKNAPHTSMDICESDWSHSYNRMKAAYPLSWVKNNKFWPSVNRINNTYGDRNLICTCPPMEEYANADSEVAMS